MCVRRTYGDIKLNLDIRDNSGSNWGAFGDVYRWRWTGRVWFRNSTLSGFSMGLYDYAIAKKLWVGIHLACRTSSSPSAVRHMIFSLAKVSHGKDIEREDDTNRDSWRHLVRRWVYQSVPRPVRLSVLLFRCIRSSKSSRCLQLKDGPGIHRLFSSISDKANSTKYSTCSSSSQ